MVGASDSGGELCMRRNHCCPGSAGEVYEVQRIKAYAGHGRARHLVLVRIVAVYHAWLAGEDEGPAGVLSDHAADYCLRDSVFLGGTHDHVRLPLHGGSSAGCKD